MTEKESKTIREKLVAVVESYAGRAIKTLHYIEDPSIDGVYAVRADFGGSGPVDLLVTTPFDIRNIEEVEFKTWPPMRRNA